MNIQNNIKSPCMGCIIRFPMCHDCCESYETYKQTCASIRQERTNYNNSKGITVESAIRNSKNKCHWKGSTPGGNY